MDVIVEGKITPDEGIDEVIQTVIDLKAVPHAILRVTCTDSDLQGRVAFSQGGYILGGCLTETGETGYSAVKKLLTIRNGNFAILDPGRTYVPEVNQSLWIKGERVIEMLPNLPETVDPLLDADPTKLAQKVESTTIGRIDAKVERPETEEPSTPSIVGDVKSKTRQLDLAGYRLVRAVFLYGMAAVVGAYIAMQFGSDIAIAVAKYLPSFSFP
ncbi:MAG TPA: hypothetical protein V6D17_19855 [Candidatus Obscuribacterales bacterium]